MSPAFQAAVFVSTICDSGWVTKSRLKAGLRTSGYEIFAMLFLLKVEVEQLPAGMTGQDFLRVVQKEWTVFSRLERKGKILGGGKLVGRRGAAAIVNAESPADMEKMVAQLPLFPYFTKIEVTPLLSSDEALADVKKMLALIDAAGGQKNESE